MAALTAYASSAVASEASSEAADAGAAGPASGAASEDLAESRPAGEEEPSAGNCQTPTASTDVHLVAAGKAESDSSDDAAMPPSQPANGSAEAATVKARDGSPEPVPPGVEGLGQTARAGAAVGDEAVDSERSQAAARSSASAGADQGADASAAGGISAVAPQPLHAGSKQAHAPDAAPKAEDRERGPLPVYGPSPRPLPMPPFVFPAAVLPPPATDVCLPGLRPLVHPASMPVPPASSAATSSPSAETVAIMDKLIRYIKVRSNAILTVLQRRSVTRVSTQQV